MSLVTGLVFEGPGSTVLTRWGPPCEAGLVTSKNTSLSRHEAWGEGGTRAGAPRGLWSLWSPLWLLLAPILSGVGMGAVPQGPGSTHPLTALTSVLAKDV